MKFAILPIPVENYLNIYLGGKTFLITPVISNFVEFVAKTNSS